MEQQRANQRRGYAIALVAVAATVLLRLLLWPLLGDAVPHQAFFPAVVIAAYYGGFRPGVLATLLGAFIANTVFTEPHFSIKIKTLNAAVALPLFLLTGLLMSALCEALHQTQLRRVAEEREHASAALREAEERFLQLAENIRDIYWTMDARGRVAYISPAYEEVWGRPRQSLYEKSTPTWIDSVHPDDAARMREPFDRLRRGVPTDCEFRIVRPDGGDRWVRVRSFPVKDQGGQVVRVAGLCEDITERKQAEQVLRESEQRWRSLTETLPQLIWTADPVGVINFVSAQAAEYTGLPEAELVREGRWAEVIHPDDRARSTDVWAEAVGRGGECTFELRVRRRDGAYRWFESRAVPIRDTAGAIVQWFGVSTDVSHRKGEEALIDAQRRTLESVVRGEPLIDVLTSLCRRIEGIGQSETLAAVCLLGPDGIHFRDVAAPSLPAHFVAAARGLAVGAYATPCGLAIERREAVFVAEADEVTPWPPYAELRRSLGLHGCLSCPVFSSTGAVLGTLAVHYRRPGPPTEWDQRTVDMAAQTVAIAIERSQAELALRESEGRFRGTFENAAVGMTHCDLRGRFLRVNQKYCDVVGYSREELTDRTFKDLTHPDDLAASLARFEPLVRGELSSYSEEKRLVHKDGSVVWIHIFVSLQCDAEGRPTHSIGVVQDISDRKRLQTELRQANDRLELAVRGSNVGIWDLHLTDGTFEGGRLHAINLWEQFGLPADTDLDSAGRVALWHPDDRDRVMRAVNACLRGETPGFEAEYRILHRDGTYRWRLHRGVAVHDPGGRPTRFIGTSVDIGERKRAEEALRESEGRFRGTFENAAVGIAHCDLQGRYLRVNQKQCDILRYPQEELLGKTFQGVTHPDDLPASLEWYGKLMRGEVASYTHEKRHIRKDGTAVWTAVTVSLQRDQGGQPLHTIGIVEDISERRRLEGELRQAKEAAEAANRAKDEFLANVSHEIRTPMNAILGMTELVLDTELRNDQRQCLRTVKSAADNLLAILNDLLDFSKIEAGKLELDPADFSLRAVVGDTLRALATRAHQKGLELVCHVQPDLPDAAVGDAGRLRQVLLNLVGNAIKFTAEGEVVVRVERGSGPAPEGEVAVRFAISDTGIGIRPEMHKRIFRAFEQEDTSTTRKYGGTGLGLSISAQLVGLMGGAIAVESEPGRGSTFSFTVRFARPLNPAAPAPTPVPVTLRGLRVLVVDDSATNRRILEETLRGWQMSPDGAADGVTATGALWNALTEGHPYSMVLLDARMPDTDGLVLAARIREWPALAATRIILLTSGDRPGDLARSRELRIDAHLLKPVQSEDLLDTIYRVGSRTSGDQAPAIRPTPPQEPAPAEEAALALRVLVAEDNEFNALLIEQLLARRGHHVRVVGNGRQALALATSGGFDLLLLDVHMPELDGFQVIRAVREHEGTAGGRLPVIALTARSRPEDRDRCVAAGMDDFLSKPIHTPDLLAAIERVTRGRRGGPAAEALLTPSVLLAACENDPVLLERLCHWFQVRAAEHLSALATARVTEDVHRLREVAHKLSGMLGTFSTAAGELASATEDRAAAGELAPALELAARVEAAITDLLRATTGLTLEHLNALAGQGGPGRSAGAVEPNGSD